MPVSAYNELSVTPESALPQLGLKAPASQAQVEAAYSAALAEIELMARNSPSQSLTDSYQRARQQIEQAYRVLTAARPKSPAASPPDVSEASNEAATTSSGSARPTPVEVSINLRQLAQATGRSGQPDEDRPQEAPIQQDRAQPQRAIAEARADADNAREETASAHNALQELRAQSQALSEDVARVRDRLKSLNDEAQALRQTVAQLSADTTRELQAIAEVRKRADGLLLSAQRNESEIATAAMHAEAYRDSAMYAAQAAERVLRAITAEATNT